MRIGNIAGSRSACSAGNPAKARITGATNSWKVKIADVPSNRRVRSNGSSRYHRFIRPSGFSSQFHRQDHHRHISQMQPPQHGKRRFTVQLTNIPIIAFEDELAGKEDTPALSAP
jgi:hypothetical protein